MWTYSMYGPVHLCTPHMHTYVHTHALTASNTYIRTHTYIHLLQLANTSTHAHITCSIWHSAIPVPTIESDLVHEMPGGERYSSIQ